MMELKSKRKASGGETELEFGGGGTERESNKKMMMRKDRDLEEEEDEDEDEREKREKLVVEKSTPTKEKELELGNGSQVIYKARLIEYEEAWKWFEYLNSEIPWTRPTIRVFGRSCLQPRDTCYVATTGLPQLVYSGYQPHAFSWDDFPPLKDLLCAVHNALPGSRFNSLLLNRYKGGQDYVGWHSDDEKLYGPTPHIASLSFGAERQFILKRKPPRPPINASASASGDEPATATASAASKRFKKSNNNNHQQYSFTLKHGSLLLMKGYTQRDWIHSVPKRAKVAGVRINLTFRLVL